MRLSKKQSLIYGCLVVLMLLVAGGSLVLNQLSDIDKLKNGLAQKIEQLTQFHVTIRGAELAIHQGVGVTLHDVSLRRHLKGPPDLTAQEIWVELGLLPLLAQELVIEKMLMRGSSIKVVRNPEGRVEFVGLNRVLDRRSLLDKNFFKIVKMGLVPQLVIQNGKIQFFDYYENPEPIPIQIENINVSIKKAFAAPSFSFLFRGNFVGSKRPAPFSISGNLRNPSGGFDASHLAVEGHVNAEDLEVRQFQPYLQKSELFESDPILLSTDSDFSWGLDGRLILSGNLKYRHITESPEPSLEASSTSRRGALTYKIQWIDDTFEIKEAAFRFGNFQLSGSGKVEQWLSSDSRIVFAIQSNNLPVESMHSYPPFSIFPKPTRLIQETLQQGRMDIRSLKFDGTLNQLSHIENSANLARLSGEVGLKRVNWDLPFVKLHNIAGVFRLASGDGTFEIEKALCRTAPKVQFMGSIKNIFYDPNGDLHVKGQLKLTELRSFLIRDVNNLEFHHGLDRFKNVSGSGNVRIHFLGSLDDIHRLTINGEYVFQKARARYPGSPHEFKNIQGKIGITHQAMKPPQGKRKTVPPSWGIRFTDFKGDFGRNGFSGLGGKIRIGSGKPYVQSTGQIKIHAPELPQWLNFFTSKRRPYDLMDDTEFTKGTLFILIKGQGRSLDPRSILTPHQIRAEDVSLKHSKLPSPLSKLEGNLQLTPQGIEIKRLNGLYGQSKIFIQGRWEDKLDFKVQSAHFSRADLPQASWLRRLNFTGPMAFQSQWTGTPETLNFNGSFDLTKTAYRFDDRFIKGAGSPNHFRVEGRWTPKQQLDLKKWVYELGPNHFHGTGKILLSPSPQFSLRISANDLKPFSLGSHFPLLRTSRGGTLRLNLAGEGNLNHLDQALLQGTIESKNLEFQWQEFPQPVYINAKADFLGDNLNLSSATIASSDSEIQLKGKSAWGNRPSVELAVYGKKLDLNDVWPGIIPLEELRNRLKKSRLFNEGAVRLSLDLDRYQFLRMNFKNLSTEISVKDQAFFIHKMDLVCPNNRRIRNRGMITLTDSGKFRIKSILSAEGIEAHDFLGQLGDTFQKGLTGKAKIMEAELESKGINLSEFTHSLNGKISIDLASGNLDTTKLMHGVWILFGNPDTPTSKEKIMGKSETAEYERIAGDFLIKDGVAETENYRYETPQRRMSLVGKFDLRQRKMDTVVGVAPLVALDKILTQIPILGKIITAGDEKSLVKTYYEVKGPFHDPIVESIPWTSLEKRVMGIFQGIFESPGDLLTAPIPGPEDS